MCTKAATGDTIGINDDSQVAVHNTDTSLNTSTMNALNMSKVEDDTNVTNIEPRSDMNGLNNPITLSPVVSNEAMNGLNNEQNVTVQEENLNVLNVQQNVDTNEINEGSKVAGIGLNQAQSSGDGAM